MHDVITLKHVVSEHMRLNDIRDYKLDIIMVDISNIYQYGISNNPDINKYCVDGVSDNTVDMVFFQTIFDVMSDLGNYDDIVDRLVDKYILKSDAIADADTRSVITEYIDTVYNRYIEIVSEFTKGSDLLTYDNSDIGEYIKKRNSFYIIRDSKVYIDWNRTNMYSIVDLYRF